MFVNTMLTEDPSGLECEAVSHTLPSCVGTLLGQPDPEDEATVTLHITEKYSHNNNSNTAVQTSDHKINTLFIAYNKGSLPGISKLSIWHVYYLSLTPQLVQLWTKLQCFSSIFHLLLCCSIATVIATGVLHATHKKAKNKNTHHPIFKAFNPYTRR